MRLSILSTSVALGIGGCFASDSRANELNDLSVVRNLASPSVSIPDASATFNGALPRHNQTEKGRFAADNSDDEARVIDIDVLLTKVVQFIDHQARKRPENLRNVPLSIGEPKELLDDELLLVHEMDSLLKKTQRSKDNIVHSIPPTQRLHNHDDPKLQHAGDAGLVGTSSIVYYAQYDNSAEELVKALHDNVVTRFSTAGLSAEQAQKYRSILTHFSENDITELVNHFVESSEGKKDLERIVLLMAADPVTRPLAFRLQLLSRSNAESFLMQLLNMDPHVPVNLPLNIWLEFIAYIRFSKTYFGRTDPLVFATSVYDDMLAAQLPGLKMERMLTAIFFNEACELDITLPQRSPVRMFEWLPKDQIENLQLKNNRMNLKEKALFIDALDNEAVIASFKAAEAFNKDEVLTAVRENPEVVTLFPVITKDEYNIKIFRETVRDRELKELANELLIYDHLIPKSTLIIDYDIEDFISRAT